jgi:glycopeptide antibiotics resistance protein
MKSQKLQSSNGKDNNISHQLTNVLFIIYIAAIFWILLLKLGVQFSYMENRNVNLIPFRELFTSAERIDLAQVIMNIVIFVPLGVYTCLSFKRWGFPKKLFFFCSISIMLEVLQYILKIGAFDITDIINNTLGGIAGLMIFEIIERSFNNSVRSQKFINLIAGIGTILMIALLILLKLHMLPVRYQ